MPGVVTSEMLLQKLLSCEALVCVRTSGVWTEATSPGLVYVGDASVQRSLSGKAGSAKKLHTVVVLVMELLVMESELIEIVEHCKASLRITLVPLAKGPVLISAYTHRLREGFIPGKWPFKLAEPGVVSVPGRQKEGMHIVWR
jgi:hypothetical protein